ESTSGMGAGCDISQVVIDIQTGKSVFPYISMYKYLKIQQFMENSLEIHAWLRDEDSPVVARLSQLISALTNLTMETAEEIQIANYGIGGYQSPHVDSYHKWENPAYFRKVGNRIATWMTYMSDVEWGGATVFPLFGGYITPKKGSTLFWYNLHASGEVDYRTLHAACPVLIGNKWVANKWIHEYGQEFRRRCSLDPMA
ncbi:unnamed protein product, partial [Rotaria magnacalcarata]